MNLRPDPTRRAGSFLDGNLIPGVGIELVPAYVKLANGDDLAVAGIWGTWRARLERVSGNSFGRDNFYFHNSQKGYTDGCIETCNDIYKSLIDYRASGGTYVDVVVDYNTTFTYGGRIH